MCMIGDFQDFEKNGINYRTEANISIPERFTNRKDDAIVRDIGDWILLSRVLGVTIDYLIYGEQ